MKKLLATTAAALIVSSGMAFAAMDTSNANAVEFMLRSYDVTYAGNLADLTDVQKAQLAAVDTSADLPDTQIQAQIISALGEGASVSEGGSGGSADMREMVVGFSADGMDNGGTDQLLLDRYGFEDVDYNSLTAQQKAALAAVDVNPSAPDAAVRAQIESALNS